MIGLALGAKELARKRSNWIRVQLTNDFNWEISSRKHAEMFPHGPTAHYYRIIDAISRGEKP